MTLTPVVLDDAGVSLRHRNQFILGPDLPREFDTWKRVRIGQRLTLAVNLDLGLTQVARNGRELTCIGYMIDPFNPPATEVEILDNLIDRAASREAVLERISRLGGRWVLLCDDGEALWLVNDALGHRQVYFTDDRFTGGIWCASQPRELASIVGAAMDKEAAGFLRDMQSINPMDPSGQRGRWWPGIGSPYAGIRHLTPNHYLDLQTKRQYRFWPKRPITPRSLESATQEGADILRGMMLGARARFDKMTLMITGGWDSRLVLTACRSFAADLSYVTLDYPKGNKSDVAVPARLLSRLGLKHEIARAGLNPSADFLQEYKYYVVMPNNYYAANAEALSPFFNRRRVAITGVAAGPLPGTYELPGLARHFIKRMTPEVLTRIRPEMENHPYAINAFSEWRDGLGDIHDHDPLDIFFWEQRTGNWHADYSAGYDLIWQDCIAPMNCRYLHEIFLGVDKRLREKPPAIFHQRLMRKLWPEVLNLDGQRPPIHHKIKVGLRKRRNDLKDGVRLIRALP